MCPVLPRKMFDRGSGFYLMRLQVTVLVHGPSPLSETERGGVLRANLRVAVHPPRLQSKGTQLSLG